MFCTQTLHSSSLILPPCFLSDSSLATFFSFLILLYFFLCPFSFWRSFLQPSFVPPSVPSFLHPPPLFYLFFKFRQGDTTWLQLTPYRAGGFPLTHSEPSALWWNPDPLCFSSLAPFPFTVVVHLAFFSLYCAVSLFLSPTLLFSLYLFLSPPMSLWASPGLVAVGSTRTSHTVTWHAIYRPSEGVALSARRMLS